MLQIIIIVLAIATDQLSKYYISNWLVELPGQSFPIINGVLNLTYKENSGMAMGLFQGSRIPLIVITFLILSAGVFFMVKERKNRSILVRIVLPMIVGGAMGNLYDRIFRTFVIDFIDFRAINFYVFNISDVFVCIGAILAIYILFFHRNDKEVLKGTLK